MTPLDMSPSAEIKETNILVFKRRQLITFRKQSRLNMSDFECSVLSYYC